MDGAQADAVVQLLRVLVEHIEGPWYEYFTGDFAGMIENLISGQLGLAALVICCTALILGYFVGKDLLVVLWG